MFLLLIATMSWANDAILSAAASALDRGQPKIALQILEKELINNIQTAFKNNFSIIIIVICGFSLYSCMRTDWVRSKPLMGVVGLLCIILAALSGEVRRI